MRRWSSQVSLVWLGALFAANGVLVLAIAPPQADAKKASKAMKRKFFNSMRANIKLHLSQAPSPEKAFKQWGLMWRDKACRKSGAPKSSCKKWYSSVKKKALADAAQGKSGAKPKKEPKKGSHKQSKSEKGFKKSIARSLRNAVKKGADAEAAVAKNGETWISKACKKWVVRKLQGSCKGWFADIKHDLIAKHKKSYNAKEKKFDEEFKSIWDKKVGFIGLVKRWFKGSWSPGKQSASILKANAKRWSKKACDEVHAPYLEQCEGWFDEASEQINAKYVSRAPEKEPSKGAAASKKTPAAASKLPGPTSGPCATTPKKSSIVEVVTKGNRCQVTLAGGKKHGCKTGVPFVYRGYQGKITKLYLVRRSGMVDAPCWKIRKEEDPNCKYDLAEARGYPFSMLASKYTNSATKEDCRDILLDAMHHRLKTDFENKRKILSDNSGTRTHLLTWGSNEKYKQDMRKVVAQIDTTLAKLKEAKTKGDSWRWSQYQTANSWMKVVDKDWNAAHNARTKRTEKAGLLADKLEKAARRAQHILIKAAGKAVYMFSKSKWAACMTEASLQSLADTVGERIISEGNTITLGGVGRSMAKNLYNKCGGVALKGVGGKLLGVVKKWGAKALDKVKSWGPAALQFVEKHGKSAYEWLKEKGGPGLELVKKYGQRGLEFVKKQGAKIGGVAKKAGKKAWGAAKKGGRKALDVANKGGKKVWAAAKKGGRKALDVANKGGKKVWAAAQKGGRKALDIAKKGGKKVWAAAKKGGRKALDIAKKGGKKVWAAAEKGGRKALDVAKKGGRKAWGIAKKGGKKALAAAMKGGRKVWAAARKGGRKVLDVAKKGGRKAWGIAKKGGKKALAAAMKGAEKLQAALTAVKDLGRRAAEFIKRFKGRGGFGKALKSWLGKAGRAGRKVANLLGKLGRAGRNALRKLLAKRGKDNWLTRKAKDWLKKEILKQGACRVAFPLAFASLIQGAPRGAVAIKRLIGGALDKLGENLLGQRVSVTMPPGLAGVFDRVSDRMAQEGAARFREIVLHRCLQMRCEVGERWGAILKRTGSCLLSAAKKAFATAGIAGLKGLLVEALAAARRGVKKLKEKLQELIRQYESEFPEVAGLALVVTAAGAEGLDLFLRMARPCPEKLTEDLRGSVKKAVSCVVGAAKNAWRAMMHRLAGRDAGGQASGGEASEQTRRGAGAARQEAEGSTAGRWRKHAQSAVDIAIGPDGKAWLVGSKGRPYLWSGRSGRWMRFRPGKSLARIALGPRGKVVTITRSQKIFRLSGKRWVGMRGPKAVDVAIGPGGTLWIAGTDGRLYHRDRQRWNAHPRASNVSRVAVGPGGVVWGVTRSNEIDQVTGEGAGRRPGAAVDIAIGANGAVWVISPSGDARKWDAQRRKWISEGAEKLVNIAVDPQGHPWATSADGQVYQMAGQ